MRNGGFLRRRMVFVGVASLLGVLFLGVTGAQATTPGAAKIIVQKKTNPEGDPTSFSFTFTRPNGNSFGFSLSDGGHRTTGQLEVGTYSVVEAGTAGWTLTSASCSDGSSPGAIGISEGEEVTCVFENTKNPPQPPPPPPPPPPPSNVPSSINVTKSANPTSLKEPGGSVTYSVRITNTSANANVTITDVVDDKFGDLDDEGGSGCFDVPMNLGPGASSSCQFTETISGTGGTSHVNTVTACGGDQDGDRVCDSDDARVDITPKVIDLVIVKDATSPTALNGNVQYTMTVTNKGPDTATNVQVADPAPVGISYSTASPTQGSCSVTAALITCSLGTLTPGQTVTITATGQATQVGELTNTATVTGSGGGEANPADNVDTATTVVNAPLTPPTPKPKPRPKPTPTFCLALTVTPKLVKVDGKPDVISVKVTAGKKSVKGVKVLFTAPGVRATARTKANGVAVIRVNVKSPGLMRISTLAKQRSCGPKRIGVVGIFLPPVTG